MHAVLLHHKRAFAMVDVNKGFRTIDLGQFNGAGDGQVSGRLAGKPQVV